MTTNRKIYESFRLAIRDREPYRKLLVLLTLALCWAHRTSEWLTAQKPLTIKKLGRKAKSIFRHNFDRMRRILLNLEQHNADFHKVLHFLSCT